MYVQVCLRGRVGQLELDKVLKKSEIKEQI